MCLFGKKVLLGYTNNPFTMESAFYLHSGRRNNYGPYKGSPAQQRPEEWTDLRFGWLLRGIYEEKKENYHVGNSGRAEGEADEVYVKPFEIVTVRIPL